MKTIEEKARAYDDAKARMSRAFNANRCTIGFMNEIFPEFRESVDEKMKKAIIHILYENYTDAAVIEGVEIAEIVTWLEEQCSTNEIINRDEFAQGVLKGAAINLITWIDYNAAEGNMCLSNMECKDIEDALISGDWDKIYAYIKKKLEKQGEQLTEPKWCHHKVDLSNCSEEYRKAYYDGWNNCNMQHSQWKAENDDRDEKIRKELIEFIKSRGGFKQEYIDWLKKQDKQNQTWEPSEAQLIVIKELIEDKNTSKVNKVILRGMLDEFKQFTNNCKRETDNYETEDSSQT